MLGYGNIADAYPYELPRAMTAAGFKTAALGKNHFMWNTTCKCPPSNWTCSCGISHGYSETLLYDGIGNGFPNGTVDDGEYDNYDRDFALETGGLDPLKTGKPLMDFNSWRGAPYVYNESLHPTSWVGSNAVRWLQRYASEASAEGAAQPPFFLKVSFHRPHSPYDPPGRILDATPASSLPPMHVGGNWDAEFARDPACGPSDPDAWCGNMTSVAAELELGRRAYYASLAFVDEWVGKLLDTLDATGLTNSTFVVFLSDHGDGQGDHWHFRKSYPYEFSSHVPFIVRWPEHFPAVVPRGSTLDAVVELRDILPTFLDVGGVALPPGVVLNGSSVACLLRAPGAGGPFCPPQGQPAWRQFIDLEHDICYNNSNHWSAMTDGQQKYVFNAQFAQEQLFDLLKDPYEMMDVSSEPAYSASLKMWRARLVKQFEDEKRGSGWVVNGTLVPRPTGTLYSPNFPH